MVFCFAAMHVIAAKRGDGLHPEILDLLKRSRAEAELSARSSFPVAEIDYLGRPAINHHDRQLCGDAAEGIGCQ